MTANTRLDSSIAAAPAQQFRYAMRALQVIANGVPLPGKYADQAIQHITCGAGVPAVVASPVALSATPRSDQLEATRVVLGQARTPAYGDALQLCRSLETEVARLTAALAQANSGCERFERKSYLLVDRVEKLEGALKEGVTWMEDCVRDVLHPLAHETTPLGATAEGIGGASVAVIRQAKEVLDVKTPE
ncbi:hypothetical protein WJ97_11595 [Burkholderia ubonensis]|uniref:hypothetical protein n=1 Tax=Burkholderia ubonensis TaxID=101571 RepID=UPI000757B591|nr:hypothetical protein [Burkholderia ubonensis]KVP96522.1 hypothetical protein WJ97_11595 [Burkholderia ubonensis]